MTILRSECELCGDWSGFTGRMEIHDGRTLAIFRCPIGHGEFSVWRPEYDQLNGGRERANGDTWTDPVAALRSMAIRLCGVATGTGREIRAAFALPLTPPPLGADRAEVTEGVLSRASVELWFAPPLVTLAELEEEFGPGEALPRTGPNASHVRVWNVRVAGAPAQVALFGSFALLPAPGSGAKSILFRIDPGI